jgi:hypothetical protein
MDFSFFIVFYRCFGHDTPLALNGLQLLGVCDYECVFVFTTVFSGIRTGSASFSSRHLLASFIRALYHGIERLGPGKAST